MGLVAAGYFELILPAAPHRTPNPSPDRGEPVSTSPSSSTGNKVTLAGMRFRDKLSKFIRPTLSMSLPPYRRGASRIPPFYERFKFFEFSGKCYVKLIGRYGWHVKHAAYESHAAQQTKWLRADSPSFAFSFYQHLSFVHANTSEIRIWDCLFSSQAQTWNISLSCRDLFDFAYVLKWINCIF